MPHRVKASRSHQETRAGPSEHGIREGFQRPSEGNRAKLTRNLNKIQSELKNKEFQSGSHFSSAEL